MPVSRRTNQLVPTAIAARGVTVPPLNQATAHRIVDLADQRRRTLNARNNLGYDQIIAIKKAPRDCERRSVATTSEYSFDRAGKESKVKIIKQIDAARTLCFKEAGRQPTELKLTPDDLNKSVEEFGNLNLVANYTFTQLWGMKLSLINDGSTSYVVGINASSFAI